MRAARDYDTIFCQPDPDTSTSPAMIRRLAKISAEAVLGWKKLAPLFKRRMSGRGLILAYHNVVPPGESPIGAKTLHVGVDAFFQQVEAAMDEHRLVSLRQVLEDSSEDESRIAITFDDAYGGVVGHALPELARLGVPATVFVPPAFVGGDSFWWDALTPPSDDALTDAARDHALWHLRGEQKRIRDWAREAGLRWREMPGHARCTSLEAILRAASLPNIDFAPHSWSHPNLVAIDKAQVREELKKSRRWLLDQDLAGCDFLAYPYGHENETVRTIAADCGYVGGLTVTGGWMRTRPDQFAIPRLNVPAGLSLRGFRLRLRGLLA